MMINIYQAWYICKSIKPISSPTGYAMPTYHEIVLGLPGGNGFSDIVLSATCSRFTIGKEYYISIAERE